MINEIQNDNRGWKSENDRIVCHNIMTDIRREIDNGEDII
jgi:hypothetical protein